MKYRIEKDSLGEIKVPTTALFGAQTQRAVDNFHISELRMPKSFLIALALIKKNAAKINAELGLLDKKIANSIVTISQEIIKGQHLEHFPVDIFQTGSGTSSNMNMNEVIANLAAKKIKTAVSPNDHVNMGQSSNDVIPTAIHLSSCLEIHKKLLPALSHLQQVIKKKSASLTNVCKTGRTHLMDAMPIRMEQELSGWLQQIKNDIDRIKAVLPRLQQLAQGGTAVGSGINTHHKFAKKIAASIGKEVGLKLKPSESFFEALSSQDTIVELSRTLKLAIALSANSIALLANKSILCKIL